jgi:2-dehydro-3-deoxyphosphogluconate aldolase / (4S)-4-hydroxy-2-oxoglutarate aldolase
VTVHEFVGILQRERAIAILRTADEEAAQPALAAAIRGGFRVVEVTLNTPGALARIAELREQSEIVVGAGTVLSVADARNAVAHGARFLVSPVLDEAVIAEAASLGVAVIPGTHTPTEMFRAHRAGAPFVKLFPASANGPEYVRACLGPMPFLRIVPTSGVDATNAARYLSAGAFALGFVSSLFEPELLSRRQFDRVVDRAKAFIEIVAAARR